MPPTEVTNHAKQARQAKRKRNNVSDSFFQSNRAAVSEILTARDREECFGCKQWHPDRDGEKCSRGGDAKNDQEWV